MLTSGNDISNHWVQVPSKRRVLLMPSTKMKGKKKDEGNEFTKLLCQFNCICFSFNSLFYCT